MVQHRHRSMPMFFCAQVDGIGLHRPGRGRHLADSDDELFCKLMGCSAAMASALIYHVNGPDEWITQHSITGLHFWLTNLLSQRVLQLGNWVEYCLRQMIIYISDSVFCVMLVVDNHICVFWQSFL